MKTRPIQSGNGCNAVNLVQSVPLCFPTFFNDKQCLKKDSSGPSEKNVDYSSHMAVSSMVPNPSENVNRETTSFATPPTSSIKPTGSDTSINNKQNIKISGLDGFRQRLLATRISERLPSSFQVQGDKVHYQITIRPGLNGLAGVVKEKLIHFDGL